MAHKTEWNLTFDPGQRSVLKQHLTWGPPTSLAGGLAASDGSRWFTVGYSWMLLKNLVWNLTQYSCNGTCSNKAEKWTSVDSEYHKEHTVVSWYIYNSTSEKCMGILLVINDLSGINALCVYHEHHARLCAKPHSSAATHTPQETSQLISGNWQ